MLASFDHTNIHAILVSESWLRPCLPSTSYSLPGFRLIRNDRIGKGGGGVAIYLRAHIPFSVVSTSSQPPPSHAGEHLFLDLTLSHSKVLLGVYYSPSSLINYFSSFEMLLENFVPSYDHVVIMGDFNTCLQKNDHRSSSLKTVVNSCNMHILPLSTTHHFPNSTPSLLDIMLVASPQSVTKHGQCPADEFSYHDLIFLSYKIRPPKAKPTVVLQRNFAGMDRDAFHRDAANTDWSPVVEAVSLDEKVAILNSLITQLYDIHAPLRAIKRKHLPAPWLTAEIRDLMHRKTVAKTRYKLRSNDDNKAKYLHVRNRCNRVCRDAYRRYIYDSVSEEDPAKVWKFLRSLGIGKSAQSTPSFNLDINHL
ncbi:hypothetical protein O3G_MSEX000772, partial [Manduca sexta]